MGRQVNTKSRQDFIDVAKKVCRKKNTITRQEVKDICAANPKVKYPNWLLNGPSYRVGRGEYSLSVFGNALTDAKVKAYEKKKPMLSSKIQSFVPVADNNVKAEMALSVVNLDHSKPVSLIPDKISGYVPFGHFNDVRTIIKSKKFYPVYITGMSGNGKTLLVEQVCSQEKQECIRVNITIETDEDDLLGGFRLVDGRTVWQNGPVIHAMERGAVLLLDEVDLGSNKMMCLQPVLEGKSVFLKKINKLISPMVGFNIIATANTKGKGSDDGRYIGTNIINDAFLERFSITLEQEFPPVKIETKILNNVLANIGLEEREFTSKLVSWAEIIRKSFDEGAVSDIISTRRLVHICEAFGIFGQSREKAIQLCLNRFDIDTKNAFMDLYKKLDETIDPIDMNTAVEEKKENVVF